MNFFKRAYLRFRFAMRPLSPNAEEMLKRIEKGEVAELTELKTVREIAAIVELAGCGFVELKQRDNPLD